MSHPWQPGPGDSTYRMATSDGDGPRQRGNAHPEGGPKEPWRHKPGDRVIRVHLVRPYHMRRVLGVSALYSAGYGNVGSSIYYALGVITVAAMGATPVVLVAAGGLFFLTALAYAEGSAMYPEAGGSASFARHAFNDLAGFLAGWAMMLSYIVTISISAFIIPPYLGHFYEPLKDNPVVGTAASIAIIVFLVLINVLGIRESSLVNIVAALLDVVTQVVLITLGFVFLFSPALLLERMTGFWPTPGNLIFGFALASLAYTGVETVSQMAEETRRPQTRVPRALMLMVVTVLVMFTGINLVAFSTMTPVQLATDWAKDPIAGVAHFLPLQLAGYVPEGPVASVVFAWFVEVLEWALPPMVALLAGTILLIATNAGLIGISRLAFSLGKNRQLPGAFCRVHRRFKTPYIGITVFGAIAVALLAPGFVEPGFLTRLGALYTFGSKLTFAFAFLSIFALRVRFPEIERPFKKGPVAKVFGKEIHLLALLGFIVTSGVWIVIIIIEPFARNAGFGWMAMGLLLYLLYRIVGRLPLVSAPEKPRGPL